MLPQYLGYRILFLSCSHKTFGLAEVVVGYGLLRLADLEDFNAKASQPPNLLIKVALRRGFHPC